MARTIIITEDMARNLADEFQMSELRFVKNSKKFLADLQVDPVGAQPDAIFKYNGLDRQKLLNAFKKNKVVVVKYHIDDHDPDGTPHTAKMGIKYSVLKDGRLDDRLEATYYELFPDSIVRPKYDHRIEVHEATGCCTVGGSGSFLSGGDGESYEYDRPFGSKSAGKKNKTSVGGNPYSEVLQEKRKKVTKNDKGEVVPETCTCGGKVTLQIKGEPVYICKECGKYYGTMPFPSKKKMNEGAWGSNPMQSDGGLDKRDDVVADAFKYIVNHIEKNGKYESDNNYHWLGVVLWTMNRFKGSYFKSTLEKSGLDKAVKDVVKNLSKDEKFIGGWSKETQNEVRKYINDFEKQYNELKEKYAIDGDNYKRENDDFEGKGLMDTIAEKDILKEAVTGEDADKSAALYVYNKDKDENWYILCACRSNRKDDEEGGKWNPPMGHLHKGESMKDGALRECLEESGIDFSKYKKEIKIRDHHTWGSNCTLQLGDYVRPEVTIDDFEPKKGDEENSKFIWLPLEDIKSKTWAWTCGENAYKFIPGEIDLIQEFDFHKAYKDLLDRRGEVELEDGTVVPKYSQLNEETDEMTARHASKAMFDKFDHSFMNSGCGSQVYGWGTYVSTDPSVHKGYLNNFNDEWIIGTTKVGGVSYEVEIPDDNGNNYLNWNGDPFQIDWYDLELINSQEDADLLEDCKKFGDVYIKILKKRLGSDKAASLFLHKLGYDGIVISAYNNSSSLKNDEQPNYVVFDENDIKIISRNLGPYAREMQFNDKNIADTYNEWGSNQEHKYYYKDENGNVSPANDYILLQSGYPMDKLFSKIERLEPDLLQCFKNEYVSSIIGIENGSYYPVQPNNNNYSLELVSKDDIHAYVSYASGCYNVIYKPDGKKWEAMFSDNSKTFYISEESCINLITRGYMKRVYSNQTPSGDKQYFDVLFAYNPYNKTLVQCVDKSIYDIQFTENPNIFICSLPGNHEKFLAKLENYKLIPITSKDYYNIYTSDDGFYGYKYINDIREYHYFDSEGNEISKD